MLKDGSEAALTILYLRYWDKFLTNYLLWCSISNDFTTQLA